MATPKKYKIDEAIITIQWKGTWEVPEYDEAHQDKFPGIQVPASLASVAASMQGEQLLIDLDKGKWNELRDRIGLLFDYKTIGKGPSTGAEWDLLGAGATTTSNHIRWVPGGAANSLAYAIGKKAVAPDVIVDYVFSAGTGRVNFWVMFVVSEVT